LSKSEGLRILKALNDRIGHVAKEAAEKKEPPAQEQEPAEPPKSEEPPPGTQII
jgi:hypothetical protein